MTTAQFEAQAHALLQSIRPWFPQDEAYLIDLAKIDMKARLLIGITLAESEEEKQAQLLFESVIAFEGAADADWTAEKQRACLEVAQIKMEQLKYDEAEDLLWQARNEFIPSGTEGVAKEQISLLIAQCRFGQGFIQEAVDRADEVLRKQQSDGAANEALAQTNQLLGWFLLHKMDVPEALDRMKTAMRLAPGLDRELVDAALEAEREGNYEKAIEYYFDSIRFES